VSVLVKKYLALSMTIVLTLMMLLGAGSAVAQENMAAPGRNVLAAPPQGQGPTDPAELEAFLDDLMAAQMDEHHIPGAALSIVRDGELFFAKGYGYADLENQIPVDPERTLFRIGSAQKVVIATAVMQLVEQGKLDLDADVNTYLDFQIPDTYPEPITLKHLMTHTAGFEALKTGIGYETADELPPLDEWVRTYMRARVRPPGQAHAYSNYSAMLALYIVERVSGLPFEQYLEENILEPLGMEHTTARQPLPPELAPDYYTGYVYVDGAYQNAGQLGFENDFECISQAGAMSTSVTDMARFMIAHLQDGRYSDENIADARILEEATAQQMHNTLFTFDPRINGLAYFFWELNWNDQWIIGHAGNAITHHAMLALLPDQNLGIFVAWNGEGSMQLNEGTFLHAFLDHYYPVPEPAAIQPPADFASRAKKYTGYYGMASSGYTTWEKMLGTLGAFKLQDGGDGTLFIDQYYGRQRYVEVEPLFFREVGGQDMLVFREDEQGRITFGSVHSVVMMAIEKLAWYESPGLHMPLLLGSPLIFLTMLIAAPVSAIRARRRGSDAKPQPGPARLARWLAVGVSALLALFTAGLFIYMGGVKWYTLLFGVPLFIKALLVLPMLAALLTVGVLVLTVLAWKDGYWGIAGRVHYTLVTVAALAFLWSLNFMNLLGWKF
jgi:CubicO group peptidase (beta-lactamase class C family)